MPYGVELAVWFADHEPIQLGAPGIHVTVWPPRVLVCEWLGTPSVSVRPLHTIDADHDAKRAKGCVATLCPKKCLRRQCPLSTPASLIIIHHHPQQQQHIFFFLKHATPSTLEAWAPHSCSADRACPRRNFAEIIEAKRARGCGALCGHRTGIAGGNLNRACPRHNFSGIITAQRARGCCAVHGHELPAQSLVFFSN